jgi:RND family efflux transporter MFP subunit
MVKTGELASPGMRLIRLVNLNKMRITADVSESFLSSVEKGEMVSVQFASLPDMMLEEPIHRVGTVIDPITRTFKVEILLNNTNEKLKPNMLSSIMIQDYNDPEALIVPSIILKQDFNGTFLFKVKEEGNRSVAEKVYVKTGKTVQDKTMILKGIEIDDQVIVTGYNLVSDGENLAVMN